MAGGRIFYKVEMADQLLIEALDAMTLIYQRRSGITHMVTEPVPEMLSAMGAELVDAAALVARLSKQFDLGDAVEVEAVISARLEELAELGMVERVRIDA
jgi:PqqD family protein of HPr-rel-A system